MSDKYISKKIAWLLRHGALESKLSMDEAGWVQSSDLLRFLDIEEEELFSMVQRNTKARYEIQGNRIRATQGHSVAGTPVSLEALEQSWCLYESAQSCWHGT